MGGVSATKHWLGKRAASSRLDQVGLGYLFKAAPVRPRADCRDRRFAGLIQFGLLQTWPDTADLLVPSWQPAHPFVRVSDNPLGGAARLGERPLRMTTSIIIHYFGWQAGRGLGHSAEMGAFPVKLTAWRLRGSSLRYAASQKAADSESQAKN